MKKVVKFGGSSLADAAQVAKVGEIIRADEDRRYVAPSAPGKRFDGDMKVTDLLYECYDLAAKGQNFYEPFLAVKDRYSEIIQGLGLSLSLAEEFKAIEEALLHNPQRDYAASRGEYLSGLVLANYLGYPFIDSAEVIFFGEEGRFDAERTNRVLGERLEGMETAEEIVKTPRDPSDKPLEPQVMESVRVDTFGQVYPFEQI